MRISARHSFHGNFPVINNSDTSGIEKKYTEPVSKIMTLNLDSIKYRVEQMRSKKKVPRHPEEVFLLSNLAPACHSQHISNDYSLNVTVHYDGCTCCSSVPSISVPLTVIPMTYMDSYGFQEPVGYMPTELAYVRVAL